jgi:hypothetical protein
LDDDPVAAGLVPAMQVFATKSWMPVASAGMTSRTAASSPMRSTPTADWRKRTGRLACMVVLGALLAGCDKCGDWSLSSTLGESQSCRKEAPPPQ